ncbi:unnamed protein product [Merluccius merluccius]
MRGCGVHMEERLRHCCQVKAPVPTQLSRRGNWCGRGAHGSFCHLQPAVISFLCKLALQALVGAGSGPRPPLPLLRPCSYS